MMRKASIAIFLFLTVAASGQTAQPVEIVTVCEVLHARASFNGKVVAVIGRVSATEEGVWLEDRCQKPLITGNYRWADIISVRAKTTSLRYEADGPMSLPDGFDFDRAVVSKKLAELETRLRRSKQKLKYWAIVYGRIDTNEELLTGKLRDGKVIPVGFGHLGGAPAQILSHQKDFENLPH